MTNILKATLSDGYSIKVVPAGAAYTHFNFEGKEKDGSWQIGAGGTYDYCKDWFEDALRLDNDGLWPVSGKEGGLC